MINESEYPRKSFIEWIRGGKWFLRLVAGLEIFFFLFTFYSPSVAAAVKGLPNNEPLPVIKGKTDSERLSSALTVIKDNVNLKKSAIDKRMSEENSFINSILQLFGFGGLEAEGIDVLKKLDAEVEKLYSLAISNYTEMEEKIKIAKLPDVFIKRHKNMVNKFSSEYAVLRSLLDDCKSSITLQEQQSSFTKLNEFLQGSQFKRKHQKFDPEQMPVSSPDYKKTRKPHEYIKKLKDEVLGQTKEDGIIKNVFEYVIKEAHAKIEKTAPGTSDLAETTEVKLTEEIRSLAASLSHDPIKIYSWVRNNILFVPSYGSMQGARMTLINKQGNAIDTASLLIALLRASDIPARYVYGSVEIPSEKVMNWLGDVDTPEAAMQMLGQGSIPNTGIVEGGEVISIQFEHVWVDAWIDYKPSRGVRNITGDSWVPMDASFKQYIYSQGSVTSTDIPFDYDNVVSAISERVVIDPENHSITNIDEVRAVFELKKYKTSIGTYVDSNVTDKSPESILGGRNIQVIEEQPFSMGLPYRVVNSIEAISNLPDRLRVYAEITGYEESLLGASIYSPKVPFYQFRISLPELNTSKLGISFEGATENDRLQIDALQNSSSTTIPLYLFNVRPVITVDDVVKVNGGETTLGAANKVEISFNIGSKKLNTEDFEVVVGDEIVVGINANGINQDIPKQRIENVPSNTASENLHQISMNYWYQADKFNQINRQNYQAVIQRQLSVGLFSSPLNVNYFFGIPNDGYYQMRTIDIASSKNAIVADSANTRREFQSIVGIYESYLEGNIFDQLISRAQGSGISAIQLIMDSNGKGIPIYYVDSSNINSILPKLSVGNDVKKDITAGVNAGKEVIVPERNISVNSWVGTGYIVRDIITGAAAYLITGGLGGGGDNPCPEDQGVSPLVVAITIIAILSLIAIVASFALAGGAVVVAGSSAAGIFKTVGILLTSYMAILSTSPAHAYTSTSLPFPDPCNCKENYANCLAVDWPGEFSFESVCNACLNQCRGSGTETWPDQVIGWGWNGDPEGLPYSCNYWNNI